MTFPRRVYPGSSGYADDYFDEIARAARSLDRSTLDRAAATLIDAYRNGRSLFVCGNGGSSAIADHLACDHLKGIRTDTALGPRVVSLSSNMALVSAIANDIGFEDVFLYQLRGLAKAGDLLITISCSGDSENVVRAARWARDNGLVTIALTGFSGGRSGEIADIHLHAEADNYGVIEDVHQSIMHVLAQYIRQAHMDPGLVDQRRF